MSGSVGWCAARRRRKEGERRVPETAWGAGREEYERGGRGGEAAAPAHHQYGSWVAAPRTATSGAGASAAQRRVQAGASKSRAATDSPRRPAALAPRASRRRESGEVRARANWTFRAPRHGRRSGGLRQRSGGMPKRVLVPDAAVRSGGAIGVGRAAAAWQQAAKQRTRRPICAWWSIPAAAAHRRCRMKKRDSDLHRSISFVSISLPGIDPSYFG